MDNAARELFQNPANQEQYAIVRETVATEDAGRNKSMADAGCAI